MFLQQNAFLMKSSGLIFTWIFSASASSLIQQIGWKKAEPAIIIGFLIVILSGVWLLVFIHMKKSKRQKKDETELSRKLFVEYITKSELNSEEEKRLNELLKYTNTANPHVIFQSASLFEQCLDQVVQKFLSGSGEDLDDEEKVLSSLRKKMGYSYLPLEHPLLSTRNIETGQKLSVFPEKDKKVLIRRAVMVLNKEFFFRIQYDPEKEETIRFFPGQTVRLAFARRSDGVYGIAVKIIRIKGSTVDFYHTMELKRNQLRQFVRVDVNLPLKFRIIKTENEESKKQAWKFNEGKIVDISGGGLSFLFSRPLVPGDIVSFKFQLTTAHFSGIDAKILRVSIQESKTATYYKHHVQFINIEQKLREKIVKYIFEKQRQMCQWR